MRNVHICIFIRLTILHITILFKNYSNLFIQRVFIEALCKALEILVNYTCEIPVANIWCSIQIFSAVTVPVLVHSVTLWASMTLSLRAFFSPEALSQYQMVAGGLMTQLPHLLDEIALRRFLYHLPKFHRNLNYSCPQYNPLKNAFFTGFPSLPVSLAHFLLMFSGSLPN